MKHNMTNEEREDLYHWYKEANEGETCSKVSFSKNALIFPKTNAKVRTNMASQKLANPKK